MRHRASRPLTSVWRRVPRAVAGRLGTLAELSPAPALFALVVTLAIGTGAFATVAHVGESLSDQRPESAAVGRPTAAMSRSGDSPSAAGPTASGRTPSSGPRNMPTRTPPTAGASAPETPGASGSASARIPIPPSAVAPTVVPSTAGTAAPPPSDPASVADVTPPQTSVTEQFPHGDAAVFTFDANEPASYLCSMDGAPYAPCADPVHLSDLDPGAHTLAVRATDLAGNTDPSPAVVSWHANRGPSVNH